MIWRSVLEEKVLKENVSTAKAKVLSKNGGYELEIVLNGERMKQVNYQRCLGAGVHGTWKMNKAISHRVREGDRVGGALRGDWRNKGCS